MFDLNILLSMEQKSPSLRALWALAWRAVVFFPLGVVMLILPFAILGAGFVLVAWIFEFALMGQWWRAAICGAAFFFVPILWRCYVRWAAAPPADKERPGGYFL